MVKFAKITLLVLINVFPLSALAQWVNVHPAIQGFRPFGLVAFGDTLISPAPAVYVSTDQGDTWSYRSTMPIRMQQLGFAGGTLFGVQMAGFPEDTTRGHLVRSTDHGFTWDLPNTNHVVLNPLVAYSIENKIFMAGFRGKVYVSEDSGSSWRSIGDSSLPDNMVVTAMLVKDRSIFIGSTSYGSFRSDDSGRTWSKMNVAAVNVNSIVALGDQLFIQGSTELYRSTDNGNSWTMLQMPALSIDWLLTSAGGKLVLACNWPYRVYTSLDSGMSWIDYSSGIKFNTAMSFVSTSKSLFLIDFQSAVWRRDIQEIGKVTRRQGTPVNLRFNSFDHTIELAEDNANSADMWIESYDVVGRLISKVKPHLLPAGNWGAPASMENTIQFVVVRSGAMTLGSLMLLRH